MTVPNKNGKISLNLNEQIIHPIHRDLEQILQQHISWILLLRDTEAPSFDAMTATLRGEVEEIRSVCAEARDTLKQTTQVADGAGQIKSQMENVLEEARKKLEELNRNLTETSQAQEQIAQHAKQADEGLAAFRETAQRAERLKVSVDTYGEEFNSFQHKLDERNKTFEDGTRRRDALLESLSRMETRINELNEQAEQMMAGATVSGLASEFGHRRDGLAIETRRAAVAFYVSIALLAGSVVPLALLLFPEYDPLVDGMAGTAGHRVDFIAQEVVRILIILPFAWLTKFTATRHARLFKLREHYSYKHSIAASVEGFKQQAPELKDPITGAAFFELLFNPADRMEGKVAEARAPNPALEYVMRKLKLDEDGRAVSLDEASSMWQSLGSRLRSTSTTSDQPFLVS